MSEKFVNSCRPKFGERDVSRRARVDKGAGSSVEKISKIGTQNF
jgi:hypothetical protein